MRGRAGLAATATVVVALCGALTSSAPLAAQPAPIRGLGDYVESSMEDWKIPGLAIAVVKDGETVWAEGFGVRDVRTGEPVDEHTIFAIGSASKAFTSAAVAMLVQEGQLSWDDHVTEHIPWFETSDPFVTRELTVRDILSHRSGLERGDQVWYATPYDRDEIVRRIRLQPMTTSLRSAFGYNNNMYLTAGQLVPTLTGLGWDEFVDRRIFAPLGMERSTTSTLPLAAMENVAQPHQEIDDEVVAIPWRNIDNVAPAGSINSSVSEMAAWLKLQLAGGEYEGRRLLDEEQVRTMHSPHAIIPQEGFWALVAPESHFLSYGLGWFLSDYAGGRLIQHGGNIDGMHAMVAMLPEEDLGVVILTNLNPNGLTTALVHRIFAAYTGGEEEDWSRRMLDAYGELLAVAEAQQQATEEARAEDTRPSLALGEYAGTYVHPMYGPAEVSLEDGALVVRRGPGFVGDLEHWHYDTFRVDWRDDSMGETMISFDLDASGDVTGAEVQGLGEMTRVEEPVGATR